MQSRRRTMPTVFVLGIFLLAGTFFILSAPNGAHAAMAEHVVVNELQADSIAGSGGSEDDFVELYNPTDSAIDLSGWSIQKSTASGTSIVKQALSGTIPASGHFLIVRNGADTAQALKDSADILASSGFSIANNNVVYLVSNDIAITGKDDPDIIDLVGFGTALIYEGAGPAPSIAETKSIARTPEGEDTDNNGMDFQVKDMPTPQNSALSAPGNSIGGTVLLTVTPNAMPAQNITPSGADIVFQVNGNGSASVNYGLASSYGNASAIVNVIQNADTVISLSGLECNTTYHYSIVAVDSGAIESDQTVDAVFTTLPCGITLDSLVMTKQAAKANNQYADGWQWEYDITVWNLSETMLKMKFDAWSGAASLDAAANMQFSVDQGATWLDISANGVYPSTGADIGAIDLDASSAGRQVKVFVRMKVPAGTPMGNYNSSYGILAE